MDYGSIVERIIENGEPGLAWLDNMRSFSRIGSEDAAVAHGGNRDFKDYRAMGGPPCLEQTLEPYEMCCLVETFPSNHASYAEFEETLKLAFLYAKTVTLGEVHWTETAEVMKRNRRIGTSISGVAQFVAQHGMSTLREWSRKGFDFLNVWDTELSAKFGVPESIKKTCVKPSGTVSLLAGATPGVHFPHSRRYLRRVRFNHDDPLVEQL